MVYWRIFGAWKKKNKSADVDLTSSVDHGQQPMKMHIEVTLLYKYLYIFSL